MKKAAKLLSVFLVVGCVFSLLGNTAFAELQSGKERFEGGNSDEEKDEWEEIVSEAGTDTIIAVGDTSYLLYTRIDSPIWILHSLEDFKNQDENFFMRHNPISDIYGPEYLVSFTADDKHSGLWTLPACLENCIGVAFNAGFSAEGIDVNNYCWHPCA